MSVNCKFVTGVEQAVTHKSECVEERGRGGYTGKKGRGKEKTGKGAVTLSGVIYERELKA